MSCPEDAPKVFNTHQEAYEWVDCNHPGSLLTITDNPDGTVSAILEVPDNDKEEEEEDNDADEDEDDVCSRCGEEPCFMIEKKENFEGLVLMYRVDDTLNNTQRRFRMYRECTLLLHGHLGKENRKKLPSCITDEIRQAFPADKNTSYVGFKEAKDKK